MNHLEALTAKWLNYNRYFVRTAVKVNAIAQLARGSWGPLLRLILAMPNSMACRTAAWP
jgi:hypothetical protein